MDTMKELEEFSQLVLRTIENIVKEIRIEADIEAFENAIEL
ncbi:hypothetical protein ACN09X_04475 [Aliarcobacter butzleri]